MISPIDIFVECCRVRAYLTAEGEFDLHDAVDGLQEFAERSGLVSEIGVDHVQAILASAFAGFRA